MTTRAMQGTICLMTGSISGLGKATALALARRRATVIQGCRSQQRGEAVRAAIKVTGPAPNVDVPPLALAVLDSVRAAVRAFEQRYDRLDVLIDNAAVFTRRRTPTPDGYETMFAANQLVSSDQGDQGALRAELGVRDAGDEEKMYGQNACRRGGHRSRPRGPIAGGAVSAVGGLAARADPVRGDRQRALSAR